MTPLTQAYDRARLSILGGKQYPAEVERLFRVFFFQGMGAQDHFMERMLQESDKTASGMLQMFKEQLDAEMVALGFKSKKIPPVKVRARINGEEI